MIGTWKAYFENVCLQCISYYSTDNSPFVLCYCITYAILLIVDMYHKHCKLALLLTKLELAWTRPRLWQTLLCCDCCYFCVKLSLFTVSGEPRL